MSGNGHVIIRSSLKQSLYNPLIFGQLTEKMQIALNRIFHKEEGDWDAADDHYVSHCVGWALYNCK